MLGEMGEACGDMPTQDWGNFFHQWAAGLSSEVGGTLGNVLSSMAP